MKLIKSSITRIDQKKGLEGIKKMIELAGRTCYKSEKRITKNSCEEFTKRMINSGHTAMLEHGTVYLTIPKDDAIQINVYKYIINPYSRVTFEQNGDGAAYVTTNYRVIIENKWEDDLKYLTDPTKFHIRRFTYRIICDRGVSHEIVRHRTLSFAQESTRYCNYTTDKFNNDVTYIIPTWLENRLSEGNYTYWDGDWCDIPEMKLMYSKEGKNDPVEMFLNTLENTEYSYNYLINTGWIAQQARQVLPNALKTEIVVTGFATDWANFLTLRCAKNAHPDIQKIANLIKEDMSCMQ